VLVLALVLVLVQQLLQLVAHQHLASNLLHLASNLLHACCHIL
jgi:hypothetical protein